MEEIMGNDSDDSYERVREQVTTYRSLEKSPTSKMNYSSVITNPYGVKALKVGTSLLRRDASQASIPGDHSSYRLSPTAHLSKNQKMQLYTTARSVLHSLKR